MQANLEKALVVRVTGSDVRVVTEDGKGVSCALRGRLRRKDKDVRVAASPQTNMVFMVVDPARSATLREWLKGAGMLIGAGYGTTRLVTHLDVDRGDVDRFVGAVGTFFAKAA